MNPATLIREGFPMYCAHFPGGDPRRWEPDAEGCTEEEIAAWERACVAADQDGAMADTSSRVEWRDDGKVALFHVAMFGCGTFWYEEDPCEPDFDAPGEVACAECGIPIPEDDTGETPYCGKCWQQFTAEGFYGMGHE